MFRLLTHPHRIRSVTYGTNCARCISTTLPRLKRKGKAPSKHIQNKEDQIVELQDPTLSTDLDQRTEKIKKFKQNQQSIRNLTQEFLSCGFLSPVSDKSTELVSTDNLEAVRELRELYEKAEQVNAAEELPPWAPYKRDEVDETSYAENLQITKSSDFLWSLQNKMFELNDGDGFIQARFNYLNYVMNLVNEQKHTLIAIDTKVINKELREIGIAVYDPTINKGSPFPTLERYHLIIDEYHGVLSTNSYHGDSLKLSNKEALEFVNSLIEKHCILIDESSKPAKIVGHSIIDTIQVLKKQGVVLPTHKNDIIDTYLLYMIPFLYHERLRSELPLKITTFLGLDTILKRFQIPFTDVHNVGNRAYLIIYVLLTLTNPYHRIKFKLDNVESNLQYMEKHLVSELEDILRSWNTKSHVSVETYTNIKQFVSKPFANYRRALKDVYDILR